MDDVEFAALATLRQLTWLSLQHCALRQPPAVLVKLPLACLDLTANRIGDEGAAVLGALRQLTWLALRSCGLRQLPAAVLELPELKVRPALACCHGVCWAVCLPLRTWYGEGC